MLSSLNDKNSESIQGLKEEVSRSWYEDGMVEISVGITLLFLSIALFLYGTKPCRVLYDAIFVSAILTSLVVGTLWLPRKLKGRFVWNKVGYSVVKDPYPKSVCVFLGLSLLCGAFFIFSIRFLSNEIAILSFGFVMFFALLSQFFQAGRMKRFLFVSFSPLFIAVISSFLRLSWQQSVEVAISAIGCVSILSGVIVYKNFNKEITQ